MTSFSTVMVGGKRYSVPSRQIGERYSVRIADVIGSLLRKPGGFARCAYRESLLPNLTFRRAWDHLQERFDQLTDICR